MRYIWVRSLKYVQHGAAIRNNHWNVKRVKVSGGAIADDVVVITTGSDRDLQEDLDVWNSVHEEEGMKIINITTEFIAVTVSREEIKIEIEVVMIERVRYCQLGVTMDPRGLQAIYLRQMISLF